ncbi:hypothetical protein PMAYCL1PPCAC_11312, partial [Pristionchus mayeri]
QVVTYSASIDCKNNLFESSSSTLELMVQPSGTEEFIEVHKIICDDKQLYYHTDKKVEIQGGAIVACGERTKCKFPKLSDCGKSSCESPIFEGDCNADKTKCEKIKCPKDKGWIINGEKKLIKTEFECRRDSIEIESDTNWYTRIGNANVRITSASCFTAETTDCRALHPIRSKCDGKWNNKCSRAVFNTSRVYCQKHFDLKAKESAGGKEILINELLCDMKTGEWKLKEAGLKSVEVVFCRYNFERDQMLLGAPDPDNDPENGFNEYDWYFLYAVIAIATFNLIIFIAIKLELAWRFRIWKKMEKKKKDAQKKPSKAARMLLYKSRPVINAIDKPIDDLGVRRGLKNV